MAKSAIPVPGKMEMDGDLASNWDFFKDSWTNYATANELHKKPKEVVAATLLSIVGKECYKVFKNLPVPESERKDPETILKRLTDEFESKRNIIYERFIFNSCTQLPDERFDRYLSRLRELISTCKYKTLEAEMLRDRIVIGIQDSETQQRLLREKDLTLEKAITICRSSETATHQAQRMEHAQVVNFVNKQKRDTNYITDCKYCGRNHKKGQCEAYGETCRKCKRKNHLARVCMSTKANDQPKQRQQDDKSQSKSGSKKKYAMRINQLKDTQHTSSDETSSDQESEVLDSEDSIYTVEENGKKKFCAKIKVKAENSEDKPKQILFQLDTGASCSTIRLRDYNKLTTQPPEPSNVTLKMYDQSILKPVGQTKLHCSVNGVTKKVHFQIVKDAEISLLSGKACQALQLLSFSEDILHVSTSTSKEQILNEYADVFNGLGKLPGVYHIETDPNVKPVQNNPRRVAIPTEEELKAKIDELEQMEVLAKVTEPTPWISSMVVKKTPKKLRICLDPQNLNKAVVRNHYRMPTMDEVAPKLTNAKVFTVVDAKDGFLQVTLDEPSSYLTTFWTPFGRYRWLRMPFGLKSAPEEFQRRIDNCIEGLPNVQAVYDDIIVYGSDDKEHDTALRTLLERCRECNLKLNKNKLKYKLDKVAYLGHILSAEGIKADPEKIRAVIDMPQPTNVEDVQRLLGVATYLAKFLPQLSTVAEPLRRLTDKHAVFDWLPQHDAALSKIKQMMTETPVLQYYDVKKDVVIECDSSEVGLGAVITQDGKPIEYASRTLSQTERNYAQIEKECLAIVFATRRFEHYILGKDNVKVQTDHKPLVNIFKKPILTSPKRLQRMRLTLQKYSLELEYKPGPKMYISDTLSRASLPDTPVNQETHQYQIFKIHEDHYIYTEFEEINAEESLFVTDARLQSVKKETAKDSTLQTLMNVIKDGWPDNKANVPLCIREYWPYRDELTTQNGLAYRGTRIIIPTNMRQQMVNRAHASHLGIQYTVNTARDIMYWPRMTAELTEAVTLCKTCQESNPSNQKEPMMTHPIPQLPWQSTASDCFEVNGEHYVVIVDLYSDYIELAELTDLSSATLIKQIKPIFATHGTPATLITDNGTNYTSKEFKDFTKEWDIHHVTSSPHHHQSNGKSEAAVKTTKKIIKKAKKEGQDIWKAILEWRNTITPGMTNSPAQRLMSRRTRTFLPCATSLYKPEVQTNVEIQVATKRQKAKYYYDKGAKELPKLIVGQPVMVKVHPQQPKSEWTAGTIKQEASSPRSYIVDVNGRKYKRNRVHLKDSKVVPDSSDRNHNHSSEQITSSQPLTEVQVESDVTSSSADNVTDSQAKCTRSGRLVKQPDKLNL